jgi:hypothetical protein
MHATQYCLHTNLKQMCINLPSSVLEIHFLDLARVHDQGWLAAVELLGKDAAQKDGWNSHISDVGRLRYGAVPDWVFAEHTPTDT